MGEIPRRTLLSSLPSVAVATSTVSAQSTTNEDREIEILDGDCTIPEHNDDYHEYNYERKTTTSDDRSTSSGGYDFQAEISTGVTYLESQYEDRPIFDEDRWVHYFVTAGHMATEIDDGGWQPFPDIDRHTLGVENLDSFLAEVNVYTERTSGYPPVNDDDDDSLKDEVRDLIYTIGVEVATTANLPISVVVSGATIAGSAMDVAYYDDEDGPDYSYRADWIYDSSSRPCQAVHATYIEMISSPGISEARVAVHSELETYDFEFSDASYLHVDADPYDCPHPPCPTTEDGPEAGTEKYSDYLEKSDGFRQPSQYDDNFSLEPKEADVKYISTNPSTSVKE